MDPVAGRVADHGISARPAIHADERRLATASMYRQNNRSGLRETTVP
jgi:hypothetical protein